MKAAFINLAIIGACAAMLGTQIARRIGGSLVEPHPTTPGDRLSSGALLGINTAPRTLLLVTSSTCRFCAESMPFYRNLVTAARREGVRVVALAWEPPVRNRAYLASQGVQVDAALDIAATGVSVRGTPTLILVRRDGTVIQSWPGKLGSASEAAVLRLAGGL